MLAIIFVAFVMQVFFRYVLNWPTGWSTELSLVTWLWLVLFGSAFVVREQEEIRFDLIYGAVGRRTRLVMSLVSGLYLIVILAMQFPAALDYVLFMKVEKTAYLKIRFDVLYFIYPIFAAAIIIRYGWLLLTALRGKAPAPPDPGGASSGL
jgi:C4-dicarboxylate transporter DctQ subunit